MENHILNSDPTKDHYSKALKQWYSFEECMKIGPNKSVVNINGFDWNIHDVCLNPEEVVVCTDRNCYLIIELAKTEHRWVFGLQSGIDTPLSSWLPHYSSENNDTESGRTREEVLSKALAFCVKRIREDQIHNNHVLLSKINEQIMKTSQLELF